MQTNTDKLWTIKKGATINGEVVQAVLTIKMLTRRGGDPKLVEDGNSEEGLFVLTDGLLYTYLPLADKQPSEFVLYERSTLRALKGGIAAFMEQAKKFGDKEHAQKLGTVQFEVNGENVQFCDIGRGGTNEGNTDNEGRFANGKSLAIRFIHLVNTDDDTQLSAATHILFTGPEDADNEFGNKGDVTPNVWVNGKVFNPEDLTLAEA